MIDGTDLNEVVHNATGSSLDIRRIDVLLSDRNTAAVVELERRESRVVDSIRGDNVDWRLSQENGGSRCNRRG